MLSTARTNNFVMAAIYEPWIAGSIYVFVALMWLVPDRRIERILGKDKI